MQYPSCSLPAEIHVADLARLDLISQFKAEHGAPKSIAKNLNKQGVIEHFHFKSGMLPLTRLSNDYCMYLDTKNRHCSIYDKRPTTCREHPQVDPKPNHCAYIPQKIATLSNSERRSPQKIISFYI